MRARFLLAAIGLAVSACMPRGPVVKTGTVDVPGASLAYEQRGDAIHTIVLIHGGLVDMRLWDLKAEPLAAMTGRRVIRYDQRGFGKSTRTPGIYSPADDLLAVMNALNVDKATTRARRSRLDLELCGYSGPIGRQLTSTDATKFKVTHRT